MAENNTEKLNNGYPFRDDIFNFFVVYKTKKHFFEFPVLVDRNTVVQEMKNKLHIRRAFCLRWTKWKKMDSSSRVRRGGRGGNFMTETIEVVPEKEEELFLHSSTLNTLTLRNFCGETFHVGTAPLSGSGGGGDSKWHEYSQDPLPAYKRKMLEATRKPLDCPP